jgi:hypothetical protein
MFNNKLLVVVLFLLIPVFHYGQHTDEINSNRPGESMSAFAVGKTVLQVETGVFGIQESHEILNYDANGFGIDFEVRYGAFLENLEFIADIQYVNETFTYPLQIDERADFKQAVLGAKYLIYDPNKGYKKEVNLYSWKANQKFNWHQFVPAVAIFAGANFTGADNPFYFSPESEISPKIAIILQNHFGDGSWVFVTNIISNYMTTEYPSIGYVITLTKGFSPKWSAFVENQGIKSDFYSDAIVRTGAAYLINKNMQVDASISTNFKDTPSILYGGIGMSWRWDGRYKPVELLTAEDKAAQKMAGKTKTKKGYKKSKK